MNAALTQRWADALARRARDGMLRTLAPYDAARVDLASNDYLSLARDPVFGARARAAAEGLPTGAAASALVNGYLPCHAAFEDALARAYRFPCALLWSAGYAANAGCLHTLVGTHDLVFCDRLIHRSMVEGVRASGARFFRFRHNDPAHLETLLTRHSAPEGGMRWILTESVYSMDGDVPDLRAVAALARAHDCVWMLDEAHALGWYGKTGLGVAEDAGVLDNVDIFVGTLGKAAGAQGAFTLFRNRALREAVVNFCPEFIYATYLSPLVCAAARVGWERARELSADNARWRARSRNFRARLRAAGWQTPDGDSPVVPVMVGDETALARLREFLKARGFDVGAIRPPAVPRGTARLRLSLKRDFDDATEDALLAALREGGHL